MYTLILNGFTSSSTPATFLRRRYLGSIVYGCRAPVSNSKVIGTDGPEVADMSTAKMGPSEEGPIAEGSARSLVDEEPI